METKTQNTEKTTRSLEERLEEVLEKLLPQDLDMLIPETAGAYALFANGLGADVMTGDTVYPFQNVIELLLVLKDEKAKYGNSVDVSLKKQES